MRVNIRAHTTAGYINWERVITECQYLDIFDSLTVTIEGFRNALVRAEPGITARDVEWFCQDSDKDVEGKVLYKSYASTMSSLEEYSRSQIYARSEDLSFHFESEGNCYVTFHKFRDILFCSGNPHRTKRLIDVSYDTSCRTFRGTLDWGSDTIGHNKACKEVYGLVFPEDLSRFSGSANKVCKEVYELVFSEDLSQFSGSVTKLGSAASHAELEVVRDGNSGYLHTHIRRDLLLIIIGRV